ncbi:RelA/SpoT protein [Vibrio chagasii]|nr:RelA/SpoT protein [Vibrio chagasii]
MKYPAEVISKDIQTEISQALDQMGIMFRIFGRVKNFTSLNKKLSSDEEYGQSKKLQDLIGIRIVLYFPDDVLIVHRAISALYNEREKDQSIDRAKATTFKPVRYNLVYDVPERMNYELTPSLIEKVDTTFELQLRTVLSEGWHEVEHDLRYKCKKDWLDFPEETRMLNGIYASLETNEWTMIKIFEEIAYGHYKQRNWESMLRQKLRLRLDDKPLSTQIIEIFNADIDLAKKFFRIDRSNLIVLLYEKRFDYPMNLENLIFFANHQIIKSEKIFAITSQGFLDDLSAKPNDIDLSHLSL